MKTVPLVLVMAAHEKVRILVGKHIFIGVAEAFSYFEIRISLGAANWSANALQCVFVRAHNKLMCIQKSAVHIKQYAFHLAIVSEFYFDLNAI